LCKHLFSKDEDIQRSALSVLQEISFDDVSINFLLENKNIKLLIKEQCSVLKRQRMLAQ